MKFTINNRLAALVLATAVVSSQFQTVAFATANINIDNYENQGEEYKEMYTNDFSNDEHSNFTKQIVSQAHHRIGRRVCKSFVIFTVT